MITDNKSLQTWVASKLANYKTILDKSTAEAVIIYNLMQVTGKAKATIECALKQKNKDTLAAHNYKLIQDAIARGEL
jgi:hypothetical protein